MKHAILFLGFSIATIGVVYLLAQKKNEDSLQEIATSENNSPSFKTFNKMIKEINTNDLSFQES